MRQGWVSCLQIRFENYLANWFYKARNDCIKVEPKFLMAVAVLRRGWNKYKCVFEWVANLVNMETLAVNNRLKNTESDLADDKAKNTLKMENEDLQPRPPKRRSSKKSFKTLVRRVSSNTLLNTRSLSVYGDKSFAEGNHYVNRNRHFLEVMKVYKHKFWPVAKTSKQSDQNYQCNKDSVRSKPDVTDNLAGLSSPNAAVVVLWMM